MDHRLMNQNHKREYGIDLWDNKFDGDRNIEIDIDCDIKIHLNINESNIQFATRFPIEEELRRCEKIIYYQYRGMETRRINFFLGDNRAKK